MATRFSLLLLACAVGCCLAQPQPPAAPPSGVLSPLPMSDVALAGEWKEAQDANQEVLMSLNASRWLCHFTTTANLTACKADLSAPWQSFVKQPNGTYAHEAGFLAVGNDVKPAARVAASACEAFCTSAAACKGYTFAAEDGFKPADVVTCYWKTSTSFTPNARTNCVADGGADKPVCSPLPGEMGLGGYYGHYQGHWLSATAFLVNSTGNATVRAAAAANVASLAAVMRAWKGKYGVDGYLFPYDPLVWDKLLAGHGAGPYFSVPFYTLHKLMAGLLDQWEFAGNAQAFELVGKMATWVHDRVEAVIADPAGGMPLWQKVLLCEWGGMNDVLYHLYAHTGDARHLATARRFNGFVFTAPLAAGVDDLSSLPFPHANFHLPEVVGNARAYELTGNATDKAVVDTFFDVLSANHSYATGGSNSGECWQGARDLGNFLDAQTQESCTQYNVLKVARRAFLGVRTDGGGVRSGVRRSGVGPAGPCHAARAKLADFYERAILNGIVGNQNRQASAQPAAPEAAPPAAAVAAGSTSSPPAASPTSYIYMQPLGGANIKPWGKSDYGFPCCWGTLSESFAKLSDSIFFVGKADKEVFVNQFAPATARLAAIGEPGASLVQESHFPAHPNKTTTLTVRGGGAFSILLRVPGWALGGGANSVTLNGKPCEGAIVPGTYLRVPGPFKDGDVLEAAFPPSLWTEPLNDKHSVHNATLAFMYGPLVLAGVHLDDDIFVPKGGTAGAKADPSCFLRRNSSDALDFEAVGADGVTVVQMMPLKDVMLEKYVVYFMTAGTKPPQPHNGYCPHSSNILSNEVIRGEEVDEHEEDLSSAGPPVPTPAAAAASGSGSTSGYQHPIIPSLGRGVSWQLVNGQIAPVHHALPPVHADETSEPVWKEYVGMGYTCSGTEFRGEVPNEDGTAAGCVAAAQAMPDCAGVNYATWRTSDPSVCYTCRIAGNVPGSKLVEAASMTSLVGPLPPVPAACPKTFRRPAFVRHFNYSVVPSPSLPEGVVLRCGHIDMEPLLPLELSDQEVSDYLQITLDALGLEGSNFLRPGECGKVYDYHDCVWQSGTLRCACSGSACYVDHSAEKFTKRNNPPKIPTPWVSGGNGTAANYFKYQCLAACKCTLQSAASGGPASTEAPPCVDSALTGLCKVCGQAFNDKLENSLVQLWCDPTDPNC